MTEQNLEQTLKEFYAASAKLDAFVDNVESKMPGQKCDFFSIGFWQTINEIEEKKNAVFWQAQKENKSTREYTGQSDWFNDGEYFARLVYRSAGNYLKDIGILLDEDKNTFLQATPFQFWILYDCFSTKPRPHSSKDLVILSQRQKKALETLTEKRPNLDKGLKEFLDFVEYTVTRMCNEEGWDLVRCNNIIQDFEGNEDKDMSYKSSLDRYNLHIYAKRQAKAFEIREKYSKQEPQKDYLKQADEVAEFLHSLNQRGISRTLAHEGTKIGLTISSVENILLPLESIEKNYTPKESPTPFKI